MSRPGPPVRLGVGLWTMQSTEQAPRPHAELYRMFGEDALAAEAHGLDSLWLSEHRLWYDGWCPAPLHAQAYAAALTTRLRYGTAVLLAPQHEPGELAGAAATLERLFAGRIELGLGLGHRDAEFDAFGLRRAERGRRMDVALQCFQDTPAAAMPPIWIGGMSIAAAERAARFGHGLILPQSLTPGRARSLVEAYAAHAGRRPRVGVIRDVWVGDDRRAAAAFRDRLGRHYAEEIGAWWRLGEHVGFAAGEAMGDQVGRMDRAAAIGSAEDVLASFVPWLELGAELIVARVNFDFVEQADLHDQFARLATEIGPRLAGVGS